MFGKKKSIINSTFGEIEYFSTNWRSISKIPLSLFGESYLITVLAVAKSDKDVINQLQENAFKRFNEIVVNRKCEIEEVIIRHFQTVDKIEDFTSRHKKQYNLDDTGTRFIPTNIVFSKSGECGLYVEDDAEEYGEYDDWDEGFVLSIIPEIKIHSKEQYSGYIYGGGSL